MPGSSISRWAGAGAAVAERECRDQPSLSVSVGISVYPEDGRTAPELLEAADRHLYKRKKAARAQGVTAG
jgi:GGDEF domain-containing protein